MPHSYTLWSITSLILELNLAFYRDFVAPITFTSTQKHDTIGYFWTKIPALVLCFTSENNFQSIDNIFNWTI